MIARVNSPFLHKRRCAQIGSRCGRVSAYVMRISPVGFQRMRELKKCHKQDIFLTERKIPFARDPSLREEFMARSHFFFQTDERKSREIERQPADTPQGRLTAGFLSAAKIATMIASPPSLLPRRAQVCANWVPLRKATFLAGGIYSKGSTPFRESRVSGKLRRKMHNAATPFAT